MSQRQRQPDEGATGRADSVPAVAGDDATMDSDADSWSETYLEFDEDDNVEVDVDGGFAATDANDAVDAVDGGSGGATAITNSIARSLGLFASAPELPVVPSVLSSIMTDALNATNGSQATAESVESLRLIVQRYEQTFKQFRQETESAIATFRQQFTDIRRKFETLKRIRQSLVMELVQPRGSAGTLATQVVRHGGGRSTLTVPFRTPGRFGGGHGGFGGVAGSLGGGGSGGFGGGGDAARGGGGSSGMRRKRWGKRTSVRQRSDQNGGGGGSSGGGRR